MSQPSASTAAPSPRTTPPFRADHVGSLLRPDKLKQARETLLGAHTSDTHLGPHGNEAQQVEGRQAVGLLFQKLARDDLRIDQIAALRAGERLVQADDLLLNAHGP